eukprot:gene9550-9625_t
MKTFGFQHNIELTIVALDDIAFTNGTGDNLHWNNLLMEHGVFMTVASPFWDKARHQDRRPRLILRGKIIAALRGFFEKHDFVEVDTGILQVSPGNETHLHAFGTMLNLPGVSPQPLYLHTSPEFACKKLLSAGEQRIFTFARAFRNFERSSLHHPEFTMLEWYRAQQDYTALMRDCAELIALAAQVAGCKTMTWRGKTCDPAAPFERLSVAAAFEKYAGIDLLATLTPEPDTIALAKAARTIDVRLADDDTWSDIFSRILSEKIEPHLGQGTLTILDEYPACEAALARKSARDPRVSERFELYACGVELANAFGELTDAVEQRRRFEAEMVEKQRIYGEIYPLDEDFLNMALPWGWIG